MSKVLLTLDGNDIAARFDLAAEVLIASAAPDAEDEIKTVVLPRPSAEMLCRVVTSENVQTVICGGIEEEYLEYLNWKKVKVIYSVIGAAESALKRFREGSLKSRDILSEKRRA